MQKLDNLSILKKHFNKKTLKKSNNLLKYIFSLLLTAFLLVFLFKNVLTSVQLVLLKSISFQSYFLSGLFLLATFIFSGFQLRKVYDYSQVVKLSWFDTFTLPMVMNFWGYIIPIQGSFIFSTLFLKSKYKTSVPSMVGIYLSVFSISLSLGGLMGVFFYIWSQSLDIVFLLFSIFLLFNPLVLIFFSIFLQSSKVLTRLLGKYAYFLSEFIRPIIVYFKQPKLIIQTLLWDVAIVLVFALWSFWISEKYNLEIPFMALLVTGFLIKITLLFKFTPGNLGLMQLGVGGIFALMGLDYASGVFISLYQLVCLVVISFPISLLISIFNFKYFGHLFKRSGQ